MYYDLGFRRFAFIDDIFNLDKKNSARFFEMLIENNLKVHLFFPNGMRGDILTPEYIDLMIKAGTVELPLALETATPRLQKLIQKNLDIAKVKENLEYIAEKYPHVILELFTICGIPTETEGEALETFKFIKALKWLHFPYVNILRLYPNTDLAQIAIENGVSAEDIEKDIALAFHEIPNTLPFSKGFARSYQSRIMYEYILNPDRLRYVIPYERKLLTEDELVQKYNSYLPFEVENFDALLELAELHRGDLDESGFISDDWGRVEDADKKIASLFTTPAPREDALKILFLDLSQFFTGDNESKLYDLIEVPLGHMYILSYLYEKLPGQVNGKIMKSRNDFNSYEEMLKAIDDFQPDVIGLRTMTFHRTLFREAVKRIRQHGFKKPVFAGGPYATSSYEELLFENDVDAACIGEGEETVLELVSAMIANNKELPTKACLSKIAGIAFRTEVRQ
jgi:radical SAM superfamily enzyme YgiQ (UPF0313 family)